MFDSIDEPDALADLEGMLRAAGGYVQPSRDLRPHVLEVARAVRGERRVRRRLRSTLLALVVGVLGARALDAPLQQIAAEARESQEIIDADDFFRYSESWDARSPAEPGWGVVEAFNKLRAQRSKLFRPPM